MFYMRPPFFKKIFHCVRCHEPCFETVIVDDLEMEEEIWLLCDECLEVTTPSLDLMVPRKYLQEH